LTQEVSSFNSGQNNAAPVSTQRNVPVWCNDTGERPGPFAVNDIIRLFINVVGSTAANALYLANNQTYSITNNGQPQFWQLNVNAPVPWQGNLVGGGTASGYAVMIWVDVRLETTGSYYFQTTLSRTQDISNGIETFYRGSESYSCSFSVF
jgi:hypothetical protein